MPVKIKERPPWKYVVFGFFSLGIYDLICLQDILNNLDIVCGYVENSEKDCCPDFQ